MGKWERFWKTSPAILLCLWLAGCATTQPGLLEPSQQSLQDRQMQTRQYDTKDEEKILSAVAGVLQDLGFTLDDSESAVGLVAASKRADATNPGQITVSLFIDLLGAYGGASPNATSTVDKVQQVKASVIVKPSADKAKTVVRATFQRIVWNASNQISRVETVKDPQVYEKFYEALSKAIFLEAQKVW